MKSKLRDFIDNTYCIDVGDFLYIINERFDAKSNWVTNRRMYVGHNRKIAAKTIKAIRADGFDCDIKIYPIHRQNEYNTLPF